MGNLNFLDFFIKAILLYFSGIALFVIADNERLYGLFCSTLGIILIVLSVVSLGAAIGSFVLLLGGIF